MKKYKIKSIIILACMLSIFTMGCSKVDVESKKDNEASSIPNMVQDKYYISLKQNNEDDRVILGAICYFEGRDIKISFIGESGYYKSFTNVGTKVEDDYIEYEFELDNNKTNDEKSNGYFRINKDKNNKLSLESTWSTLNGELNLVDREECSKIIYDNFEYLEMNNVPEEFNKEFNLDIEGLKEISSNNEEDNNEEDNNEEDNNTDENNNSTNQSSSFTIEDAIKILRDKGYYKGRDDDYIKGDCVSRDIETGKFISDVKDGLRYYLFIVDKSATYVYENGQIKGAAEFYE